MIPHFSHSFSTPFAGFATKKWGFAQISLGFTHISAAHLAGLVAMRDAELMHQHLGHPGLQHLAEKRLAVCLDGKRLAVCLDGKRPAVYFAARRLAVYHSTVSCCSGLVPRRAEKP